MNYVTNIVNNLRPSAVLSHFPKTAMLMPPLPLLQTEAQATLLICVASSWEAKARGLGFEVNLGNMMSKLPKTGDKRQRLLKERWRVVSAQNTRGLCRRQQTKVRASSFLHIKAQ